MIRTLGYGRRGAQGPAGPAGATGAAGSTGATGAAGSNASATPLSNATPQALGTATAGASTDASRADHVHPLPSGRLQLVGNLNATETLLISLSVGMKRKEFSLTGVATTDKLMFTPNGVPTAGCEAVNVYPGSTANTVNVGYYTPLLGIGATYSMPITVYKVV